MIKKDRNKKSLLFILIASIVVFLGVLCVFITSSNSDKTGSRGNSPAKATEETQEPEIEVEIKSPEESVTMPVLDSSQDSDETEPEIPEVDIDSITPYDDDHDINADFDESSDDDSDDSDNESDDSAEKSGASGDARKYNSNKRVVCWGDSLTQGTGGDGVTMPGTLAELSGATVLNYGVYNEKTSCISARQGGNPQHLINDTVIPSEPQLIPAQVEGKYGYETLLDFGDAGINPVTLNGIEGTYAYDDNYNRCFIRSQAGAEVTIPAGTELITFGMRDKRDDDILVIWASGNDSAQNTNEIPPILQKIDEMLEYQGCSEYIVISDTNPHCRIPVTDEVNKAFKRRYGKHFLNLREYLTTDALSDMGIEPTDADKRAMENGDVPFSLRLNDAEDEAHGNADFYRIAGEQVYYKMQELGYLK